jgi:hypothetical protein
MQIKNTLMPILRKGILIVILACLLNLVGWVSIFNLPSYAASTPEEELADIREDKAKINPEEFYEKATKTSEDPKMGVEKNYEKNLKEFYKENPEEGGLVEGAKQLVDKATGKN